MNSKVSDTRSSGMPENAKARLREEYLERRGALKTEEPDAENQITDQILSFLDGIGSRTTAGYVAIGSELDLGPALRALHERGTGLCLPVNEEQPSALTFRTWTPKADLIKGPFGTLYPDESAEVVDPDVILVPLVAFDLERYRIGYGQGFYDRTLAERSKANNIVAYGIAFDGQETQMVPHDEFDMRLDGIITPTRIISDGHTSGDRP